MRRAVAYCLVLAPLSLGSLARAQSEHETPFPLLGPVQRYRLDYGSGLLTPVGWRSDRGAGIVQATVGTYRNDCSTGFFLPLGTEEAVDWGFKAAGASGIVQELDFAYATDSLDLGSGGPGATLSVSLYSGPTGGGVLAPEVARFDFTGLPGSTSGVVTGFVVTVDLTGGFEVCLPDGDIAYGYCTSDVGAIGTGPLITDIGACPNGQADAFDSYACPAPTSGVFNGTFSFGGSPTASFYLSLSEEDGSTLAAVTRNGGAGLNFDILESNLEPPRLGQLWPLRAIDSLGPHPFNTALWYETSLPPGTLTLMNGWGVPQEVIVDPTSLLYNTQTVSSVGAQFDHAVLVPKDTDLVGLTATVQAVGIGGLFPYSLSNALDIVVGF